MSRLNLEQIGQRAGVSRSTVSRVVNGEPNVSPTVRARVEAVIAETGYRPHAAAKSLASKRTGVIGLVIPSAVSTLFDNPYFGRLILGVSGATNDIDLTLALLLSDDQDSLMVRVVTPGLVDGVVVTATQTHLPVIAALRRSNVPFVVVGRPDDDDIMATVDVTNAAGAKKAAQHLVSLGRSRLAMIGAPGNTSAGVDRREGFLAGVREAGLSLGDRYEEGDWSQESGRLAMVRLLDGERPDAVFVASDRMAVGALRALHDAGLRCPDDVSIVSFDGLIPAEQTDPQLTSVTQPVDLVGDRAVRLLQAVINGDITTPEHVVFSTELIVRESCGGRSATTHDHPGRQRATL